MQFLNFTKIRSNEEELADRLERESQEGDWVEEMLKTAGWQLIEKHFADQVEIYKTDMLLGCKTWEEYQDKRAKAFAMELLLTDIQDFVHKGEDAKAELKTRNR